MVKVYEKEYFEISRKKENRFVSFILNEKIVMRSMEQ